MIEPRPLWPETRHKVVWACACPHELDGPVFFEQAEERGDAAVEPEHKVGGTEGSVLEEPEEEVVVLSRGHSDVQSASVHARHRL